jgi:hypothetical protein
MEGRFLCFNSRMSNSPDITTQLIFARWGESYAPEPGAEHMEEGLTLALDPDVPEDATTQLCADFSETVDGQRQAMGLSLDVDPNLTQRGVATRLISALACIALDRGVTRLSGYVTSPYALKAVGRLFSEDRLTFIDVPPPPQVWAELPLPMSLGQAVATLEALGEQEVAPGDIGQGFSVEVDLTGLSARNFERPIEINHPVGNLDWI